MTRRGGPRGIARGARDAISPRSPDRHHAAATPADDPAVAMAGLGLTGPQFVKVIEVEFPFGGKTAAHGVPIR